MKNWSSRKENKENGGEKNCERNHRVKFTGNEGRKVPI